jgi:hypothetical protein
LERLGHLVDQELLVQMVLILFFQPLHQLAAAAVAQTQQPTQEMAVLEEELHSNF